MSSKEQYIVQVPEESEIGHIRDLLRTIGIKRFIEVPPYKDVNNVAITDIPFWFLILCNKEQHDILAKENVEIILDSATFTLC